MAEENVPPKLPAEEVPDFQGVSDQKPEVDKVPAAFKGVKDQKLPPRDRAVVGFGIAILAIIGALCFFVAYECYMPALSLGKIPFAEQKDTVENFKNLSGIVTEHGEKIFDVMLSKGLLPVFATVMGFLLGQGVKKEE